MDMVFEKFTKKGSSGGRSGQKPYISLRRSGTVGVNNAATEKYLDGYDWGVMAYDKVNRLVGIELHEQEVEGAYKIRKSDREGHGSNINCRAFTREYGLIPDRTTRYDVQQDNEGEMLILELDEPAKKIQRSS
jgi:alkanesulfonate monooxygenase SsuD/methylene tetrahydromethanopterin reductase-like flavin-dependent oxidoreductase (luciferase family)